MPEGPEQYAPPEAERKVSLRHILTYDNPKLAEYQRLIQHIKEKGAGVSLSESFAPQWKRVLYFQVDRDRDPEYNPPRTEKARAYFREKLTGETLIDVGGGRGRQTENLRALAKKSGVQTYINVDLGKVLDPYTALPAEPIDYWQLPPEERARPMDEYLVEADMLDFVARIPNNSSHFAVNGIDSHVLSYEKEGDEYANALFEEMVRATKVGGILFGIESDIWQRDERLKLMSIELGFADVPGGSEYKRNPWLIPEKVFEKTKE